MDRRTRTAPDGDSRVTGSSDPYLGDLVRQGRTMGRSTGLSAGCSSYGWDGVNRREDDVACYDPYVVDLARSGRSSGF